MEIMKHPSHNSAESLQNKVHGRGVYIVMETLYSAVISMCTQGVTEFQVFKHSFDIMHTPDIQA